MTFEDPIEKHQGKDYPLLLSWYKFYVANIEWQWNEAKKDPNFRVRGKASYKKFIKSFLVGRGFYIDLVIRGIESGSIYNTRRNHKKCIANKMAKTNLNELTYKQFEKLFSNEESISSAKKSDLSRVFMLFSTSKNLTITIPYDDELFALNSTLRELLHKVVEVYKRHTGVEYVIEMPASTADNIIAESTIEAKRKALLREAKNVQRRKRKEVREFKKSFWQRLKDKF